MSRISSPSVLDDAFGTWCAYCLQYIPGAINSESARQDHHVVQSSFIRQQLNNRSTRDWSVPVHARCHQRFIDRQASAITLNIRTALDRPFEYRTRLSSHLHHKGHYGLSNIFKEMYLTKLVDPTETQRTIEDWFASSILVKWTPRTVASVSTRIIHQTPILLSSMSKVAVSAGKFLSAKKFLIQAEQLARDIKGERGEHIRSHIVRSKAFRISRELKVSADDIEDVNNEINSAYWMTENAYTRSTTLALQLTIALRTGDEAVAFSILDELFQYGANLPWPYQALCYHAQALLALRTKQDTERIYSNLSRAQFILAMTGQDPYVGTKTLAPNLFDLPGPAELLRILPMFNPSSNNQINMRRLEELRRRAIGTVAHPESIWARMMDELSSGLWSL